MDIANEVAQYLDDANLGTVGTDIFIGQIPDTTNGVYIIRSGGTFSMYLPTEETILDIYAKNTRASTCITTLENIKRYVHRMHNTLTASSYIYSILVIGDVEDVQRDEQYGKIYKITIQLLHRSTGLIS